MVRSTATSRIGIQAGCTGIEAGRHPAQPRQGENQAGVAGRTETELSEDGMTTGDPMVPCPKCGKFYYLVWGGCPECVLNNLFYELSTNKKEDNYFFHMGYPNYYTSKSQAEENEKQMTEPLPTYTTYNTDDYINLLLQRIDTMCDMIDQLRQERTMLLLQRDKALERVNELETRLGWKVEP